MTKTNFWSGVGKALLKTGEYSVKGAVWAAGHTDELLAILAAIEAAKKGQPK